MSSSRLTGSLHYLAYLFYVPLLLFFFVNIEYFVKTRGQWHKWLITVTLTVTVRSRKRRNELLSQSSLSSSFELRNWPIWPPNWGLWKNEDGAQPRCRTNVNIGPKECCWHNKIKHSPLRLRVQLHVHIHQSRITLSESVLNDLIPRHFLSHCACCSIPCSRHMHFGNQHGCKPCTRPKVTLADGSAASAE